MSKTVKSVNTDAEWGIEAPVLTVRAFFPYGESKSSVIMGGP